MAPRSRLLASMLAAALLPQSATAEGNPPSHYPPGFDCSAVPAGSQRQACNRAHLDPPMGAVPEARRAPPETVIRTPKPVSPRDAKPPTIPRLPGTIEGGQ